MSSINSGDLGMMNPDSKIVIFLNHCGALILNNFLWLICCIPIVTAGAATRAMYANLNAHLNDEECGFLSFFRHFRKDFLRSCGIGLILIAVAVIALTDILLIGSDGVPGGVFLVGFIGFGGMLTAMFGTVVFPLMVRFELPFKKLVITSFSVSIGFLPRVLPAALLQLVATMLFLFFTPFFVKISLFWALLGFALTAMLTLKLLNPVLDRLA